MAGQGVDADAEADRETGRGELFEYLEVDLVRLVAAAVFGVVREAEQSRFGEEGEGLPGEVPRLFPSDALGTISRSTMSRTSVSRSLDSSVGS